MDAIITDARTDAVCFSSLITKFRLWGALKPILLKRQIPYAFIPHTKDIWVRDFMPIQINTERFVAFSYAPSYLARLPEYHTDWARTEGCIIHHHISTQGDTPTHIRHSVTRSEINLDGGNTIKCDDCIIITDRIFRENASVPKTILLDSLEKIFSQEVFIIPSDPLEMTGHADGMVRYIGNNTILLNHYADFDPVLRKRLLKTLSPRFTVAELCWGNNRCPNTNWAYINYLQIGNLIIAPSINKSLDDTVIPKLEEILHSHVHTIPALGIVRLGGGLNCLSWTTKGLIDCIEHNKIQ